MTSCLPRLYTSRLPSGDQLGNPLFTPSSAISRYPEPSGFIKAICADGNPAARKYLPTQKAIISPAGDQTASKALDPSLWNIGCFPLPSAFIVWIVVSPTLVPLPPY